MKYKRKSPNRRIWRKMGNLQMTCVGEWSRMLHNWWKKDVVAKNRFKKEKMEIEK